MSDVIVRKATIEDAAEIANVHINSWREAYKGLLPQSFLDERPLLFKNRYQLWKKLTVDEAQFTYVAECPIRGVIGFVNGEKGRDKEFEDYGEVSCIYLLQKYHGKKIGMRLLQEFFSALKVRGFNKAYLWVLKDNPTIKFYEKSGGVKTSHEKEDVIGEQKVTELCYSWEKI